VITISYFTGLFKNSDLDSIRIKIIVLYLLNVSDIILTILLINTGLFIEANLIMAPIVYNNQPLSLALKIIVPLILLAAVAFRMRKASVKQLFQANIIVTIFLIYYGLINISHAVWFFMYVL
jgi:hypothetical protein